MDTKEAITRMKLKLQQATADFSFNQTEGSKICNRIEKETCENAIKALEKQVPVKPILENNYICGSCKKTLKEGRDYCPNCGQKIDWS